MYHPREHRGNDDDGKQSTDLYTFADKLLNVYANLAKNLNLTDLCCVAKFIF